MDVQINSCWLERFFFFFFEDGKIIHCVVCRHISQFIKPANALSEKFCSHNSCWAGSGQTPWTEILGNGLVGYFTWGKSVELASLCWPLWLGLGWPFCFTTNKSRDASLQRKGSSVLQMESSFYLWNPSGPAGSGFYLTLLFPPHTFP